MEASQRPGMPEIVPSGDPQPFTSAQPGANAGAANAFAADFLAAAMGQDGGQPPAPPVPPQPSVPQPRMVVSPQSPEPSPAPSAPQTFDRYAEQKPENPLDNLEQLPALEPQGDVAQPQGMGDKANYAFAELKSKWHASRKQAEELLTKYNALVESTKGFVDEKAAFADQLNAKDAEIKQLQEDLGKIELSRSPAFKEKYDSPIEDICAQMAETLRQCGVENDESYSKAYDIMTADPSSVGDLMTGLPPVAQGELMIRAREAQKLFSARADELNEWRSSQIGLEAVEGRENDIRFAQHQAEMADRAIEILRGLAPEKGQVPAYAVTDSDFVADREAKERQFKEWLVRAPEDQRYAAMLEGFMAPKTYEMLQQTMIENYQLKQALQSRMGFQAPRSVPVRESAPEPTKPQPKPPLPYEAPASTDAAAFAGEFMRQMLS